MYYMYSIFHTIEHVESTGHLLKLCCYMTCFIFQLPIRTGLHTTQSIQNVEQNKECLINVSKHKFSLVINGLTKTLQSVDSMVSPYINFMLRHGNKVQTLSKMM